eukprot:4881198-Alexandrium_andersonii.AAC.1
MHSTSVAISPTSEVRTVLHEERMSCEVGHEATAKGLALRFVVVGSMGLFGPVRRLTLALRKSAWGWLGLANATNIWALHCVGWFCKQRIVS